MLNPRLVAGPFLTALVVLLAACAAPASTSTTGGTSSSGSTGTTGAPATSGMSNVSPVCTDTQVFLTADARTNYSLGYENYKNEDFCATLPYLRWMLANDGTFTGGTPDDRNYRRLADVYENLAAMVDSSNTTLRKAYLDSSLAVRDQVPAALRAANLPVDESAQLIAKGRFYQIYAEDYPDMEDEVFDLYTQAFRANPEGMDDYYLNFLAQNAPVRLERAEALALLADLRGAANDAAYITAVEASFQAGEAVAAGTPEEQLEALYAAFQEGDRDANNIRRLAALSVRLDRDDVLDAVLPLVAAQNPSPSLYLALAARACRQGNTAECFENFDRAAELAPSGAEKRDIFYQAAARAYRNGSGGQAYRYAGRALQFDSGHGPSLYLQAAIVAGTVSTGSVQQRAAYWCVADLFRRAANTGDPQIAADARRAAARYNSAGPSGADYLFLGWRPGQSVTTSHGYGSCTTTVR